MNLFKIIPLSLLTVALLACNNSSKETDSQTQATTTQVTIENDSDNDGYSDDDELLAGTDPLDENDVPVDTDGDGLTDVIDQDDDNDGVYDIYDAFSLDKNEWEDFNLDGIGDNAGVVKINNVIFDDERFAACIKARMTEAGVSQLNEMTVLNCPSQSISSVSGLMALTGLTSLYLNKNPISSIELSTLTNLTTLSLDDNHLDNIDLSALINLYSLNLTGTSIISIDLTGLTNLNYLNITNNHIKSIDLSPVPVLRTLYIYNNNLSNIDLSVVPNLTILNVKGNKLRSIDLSFTPDLYKLDVSINELNDIDLSTSPNLEHLNISENALSSINLSSLHNLNNLIASENKLSVIKLSDLPDLIELDVSINELSDVDLSNVVKLTALDVSNNKLNEIDLTTLVELTELDLSFNQFSDMNLSSQTKLSSLDLSGNHLSTEMMSYLESIDGQNGLDVWEIMPNPNYLSIQTFADYKDYFIELTTDIESNISKPLQSLYTGWSSHNRLLRLNLNTGSASTDLVLIEGVEIGAYLNFDSLEDLTSKFAPFKNDMVDYAVKQGQDITGAQKAVPIDLGPGVMFYRRDLMQGLGFEVEEVIKSWDSWVEYGEYLRDNHDVYLVSNASAVARAIIYGTAEAGHGIYTGPNDTVLIETTRFKQAFNMAIKINDLGLDANTGIWNDSWYNGFKTGSFATDFSSFWILHHLESWIAPDASGLLGVSHLPNDIYANLGGTFAAIPTQANNKDDAWKVIEYMISAEAQL
ncbi:MAG: extracellular solute-binding protein, partial [Pseudomonadales bacterium]|nr:extracellular solute-binding protein [Pseudomonadales bacterium]